MFNCTSLGLPPVQFLPGRPVIGPPCPTCRREPLSERDACLPRASQTDPIVLHFVNGVMVTISQYQFRDRNTL